METALLERNTGGIKVSVHYGSGNLALTLIEGEYEPFSATIPPDKVIDAFTHPYCYLTKEDIEVSRMRRREAMLSD